MTFWSPGQPTSGEVSAPTLQYTLPESYDDFTLVPPLWKNVSRSVSSPGFLIEVPALTTDRNDWVNGTEADERADGGGGDDILLGAGGNDTLSGNDGNDRIDGGEGNDTLSGGDGNDVFVMQRDGGVDLVLDLEAGDRVDIGALGLLGLSELRLEQRVESVALHASGSTMVFQGVDAAQLLDPGNFTGGTIFVGTTVSDAESRALKAGDQIHADEIPGLRYRADPDSTGDAGDFRYVVRDPWSLENGFEAAGGKEPRDRIQDGGRFGTINIEITPVNDAPSRCRPGISRFRWCDALRDGPGNRLVRHRSGR